MSDVTVLMIVTLVVCLIVLVVVVSLVILAYKALRDIKKSRANDHISSDRR